MLLFFQLLLRDAALEELREERDELRAEMEERAGECVHLSHASEELEAGLVARRDKAHTLHLEVRLLSHASTRFNRRKARRRRGGKKSRHVQFIKSVSPAF